MTVSEIEAYVSYLVDDLEFGYFTKPQLIMFINQAQREVQKKLIRAGFTWYLKEIESTVTVANQNNYALPADFLEVNRLQIVTNPGPNEDKFTINSLNGLSELDYFQEYNGQVRAFYLRKNDLILVPRPAVGGKYLRMQYNYKIADVTADGDTPDIPQEYMEYLAQLVAIKCFIKDGREYSLLAAWTKVVEENLEAMATNRLQDKPRMVIITQNDFNGPVF